MYFLRVVELVLTTQTTFKDQTLFWLFDSLSTFLVVEIQLKVAIYK